MRSRHEVAALTVMALAALAGPAAGQDAARDAGRTCVDVTIGSGRYYDCLNATIARQVPGSRSSAARDAPYTAASPAPAVGTFDRAATAERLGNAFGHSAFPQRPPPPVFPVPLLTDPATAGRH